MVDYQYVLAVHADAARNKKKRRIEPRFEKGGLMDIEQDDLMMLIPPLFSLKDMPEQLVFQRVDFRIPKSLRDCAYANSKEEEKASWKDICSFKVVPRKKFSSLQLYDLQDEYIQEEIRKPPERTTCRQSTGWFSRGTFDQLRLHVRVRFLSLISGDAARALVQSEIKLLERLGEGTRLESDSDGQDHVDKGLSSIGASNFTSKTNHESQLLFEVQDPASEATGKRQKHGDMMEEEEEDDEVDEEEEEEEEEMEDYDYPALEGQRFGSASPHRNLCILI